MRRPRPEMAPSRARRAGLPSGRGQCRNRLAGVDYPTLIPTRAIREAPCCSWSPSRGSGLDRADSTRTMNITDGAFRFRAPRSAARCRTIACPRPSLQPQAKSDDLRRSPAARSQAHRHRAGRCRARRLSGAALSRADGLASHAGWAAALPTKSIWSAEGAAHELVDTLVAARLAGGARIGTKGALTDLSKGAAALAAPASRHAKIGARTKVGDGAAAICRVHPACVRRGRLSRVRYGSPRICNQRRTGAASKRRT